MPKPSPNQQKVIDFLFKNKTLTTKQANELIACNYYHNGEHYVSQILTNMVKRGILKRESRGNYVLGGNTKNVNNFKPVLDANQIDLF